MKPIHKFNNGNGDMVCNSCGTVISTGKKTSALFCNKCLQDYIYKYPIKYEEGFTGKELSELLTKLLIVKEKFFENLGVHTGMVIEGNSITYHTDVFTATKMCYEDRDSMYWWEFD